MTKYLVALGLLGLVACSPSQSDDSGFHIDPAIQGQERRVISEVMRLLPPAHRDNVIYFSESGAIYANKVALKSEFRPARRLRDNIYQTSWGERFVAPASGSDASSGSGASAQGEYTCASVNTGPFRRVATQAGANVLYGRYSYASADIFAPGDGSVYGKTDNNGIQVETPYIYMGGQSSTGVEVDAGLQWSNVHTDWALFLRVGGALYNNNQVRLNSPATVTLEHYVPADGTVVVRVAGGTVRTGSNRSLVAAAGGWTRNGVGNTMKRITSIAQSSLNLTSGSYLLGVSWANAQLGRYSGTTQPIPIPDGQTVPVAEKHLWGYSSGGRDIDPDNVNDVEGVGCSMPTSKVSADVYLAYMEDVSIDLR